jgi:peroxiredoxin Q/BCP
VETVASGSDFIGRMPQVLLVDLRTSPRVAWRHRGHSTFDRPDVEDLLDCIDRLLASDPTPQS